MPKIKITDEVKKINEDIISKYFQIDGNIATLKLFYNRFSDLIDNAFGDDLVEKFNDTLFDDISSAINILPKSYKLRIEIDIKDFGNYTKEKTEKIIVDNIKLFFYTSLINGYHKIIKGFLFIIIGIALMFLSYLIDNLNLQKFIYDFLNISATLFIWEGISGGLLEVDEGIKKRRQIAKQLIDITITKGQLQTVIE